MSPIDQKSDLRLAELLTESRLVDSETLQKAKDESKKSGASLIDTLCKQYDVDETSVYQVLSSKTGIHFLDLKKTVIQKDILRKVPVKIARHYSFMPVELSHGKLLIAVDSPMSIKTQDEIRLQLGMPVIQNLAKKQDIVDAQIKHYGFAADTVDRIVLGQGESLHQEDEKISSIDVVDRLAGDATVIDLVNEIIFDAYERRATDIHFEPYRNEFRLRYRIDGILQDANLSQKARHLILPIMSRIKIVANLDIVEKRMPQDGRAIVRVKNQNLDLRISCIPSSRGESIVIRILPNNMIFDLKKLGLSDRNIQIFEHLIRQPNGIILLTGPTGSGKTTTLYACLQRINSEERKVITIEDPVEYEIPGITQIQVAPKSGLDFAKGLRSVLRHDPDILMVGEVRDFETAEIAIRSALTGHLVFSTLHTNDAASGVTRLVDIGVEPFLVASSVQAIIAQRLVRMICSKCATEDFSQPEVLRQRIAEDLAITPAEVKIYKGLGCEACNYSGYFGRTSIHEILIVSEAVKKLVTSKASGIEIRECAISEGMDTLMVDGWKKVVEGITTPSEVMSVVNFDFEPVISSGEIKNTALTQTNQRTFERLDLSLEVRYNDIEVRYRLFEKDGPSTSTEESYHRGYTQNISAGGIGMDTDQIFLIGTLLDLDFSLGKPVQHSVRCLGRIVRIEESKDGGSYFMGIMFLDLSSADRNFLAKFIKKIKLGE